MRNLFSIGLLLALTTIPLPALGLVTAAGLDSPVSQPAAEVLQHGLDLYRAGRYEEALPELRLAAIQSQDSPDLPQVCLALGRIYLDRGQNAEALAYLARIPSEARGMDVQLVQGLALVGIGEAAASRDLLLPLSEPGLTPEDRLARLRGLASADGKLGKPLSALTFLARALPRTGKDRVATLDDGHVLVQQLSDPELAEAAFMFRGQAIGEDARLQQALRAERRGDRQEAQNLATSLLTSTVSSPYRAEAAILYQRLTGHPWLQRAIGVLLPLSGKYAAFGELVQRGLDLALAGQAAGGPAVRFIVRDSAADPEATADAVSRLVREDGVMAIAGPITGTAAQAAAERAQQERVPLLALSPREGLPEIGDEVFRDSLTTRIQVETLARYAVEVRGLRAFGMLFPDNRLGREMAELFAAEVQKRGGRITAQASYPEAATDFRPQIRSLLVQDQEIPPAVADDAPVGEEKSRRKAAPPRLFEALFIPDYADKISLIAPQLPYYGIENLPLFGINGWNSQELLRTTGAFLEGAVFVDGFFVHSSSPQVRDFVERYQSKYQDEPTILDAQGFDAGRVLVGILADPTVVSREDVRLRLSQLRNFPGVTGTTSFNPQGEAEKDLFLLQISRGKVEQIN